MSKKYIVITFFFLIFVGLSAYGFISQTGQVDSAHLPTPTTKLDAVSSNVIASERYQAYAPSKIAEQAARGKVVLFFHAPWCPICRGLEVDIQNNLGTIPQNVTILKVDYDSSTDLKKKYGVTYQHTFVEVDKDGKLIRKWGDSMKIADVISKVL